MKSCTKCLRFLPDDRFAFIKANRGRKERIASWCNSCVNAHRKTPPKAYPKVAKPRVRIVKDTKLCRCCDTEKPNGDFQRGPTGRLSLFCIECNRKKDREYDNTPERRARAKAWFQSERGKQIVKAAKKQAREANPQRTLAQYAVRDALRYGRMTRQPCWVCGEKAEAHHADYDRPLDVVWLCRLHHRHAHAAAKPLA